MVWYFIIFQHQYTSKSTRHTQEWSDAETITNIHPIEFLLKQRDKYGEDEHAIYHYRLLFWTEISEDVALKFKERFE